MAYKNKEDEKEYHRKHYLKNKEKSFAKSRKWKSENHDRVNELQRNRNKANPIKTMIKGASDRCKRSGLLCSISEKDIVIPERCPYLGIFLERGNGRMIDSSPSLDRIDSSKGYIPGNVQVISLRAN